MISVKSMMCICMAILPMLTACAGAQKAQMPTVAKVELSRFMGSWYVIANIPTWIETGAHNAVERYELADDGTINTTFTFNKDAFDGPLKSYHPRGFVKDDSNALWGMRFIWPFKADYRIIYLNDDYSQTVIGRQQRDYVWIMARTPTIPETDYQRLLSFLTEHGYDVTLVQKVPQRQPGSR